jgi:hypothetical protein
LEEEEEEEEEVEQGKALLNLFPASPHPAMKPK